MRVAVTVFGSTISPLFDAARRLMVADVDTRDSRVLCEEEIGSLDLAQRMALLTRLRVKVLVCGAISEFYHNALLQRDIEVYPWVSGELDDVLGIMTRRWRDHGGEVRGTVKLAIPSVGPGLDSQVAPTFRRCSHLIVVEGPGARSTVTAVEGEFSGRGGCSRLARLIVEAEARVLLTGRCGPNALGILAIAGVEVVQGVDGRVEDAVEAHIRTARSAHG